MVNGEICTYLISFTVHDYMRSPRYTTLNQQLKAIVYLRELSFIDQCGQCGINSQNDLHSALRVVTEEKVDKLFRYFVDSPRNRRDLRFYISKTLFLLIHDCSQFL